MFLSKRIQMKLQLFLFFIILTFTSKSQIPEFSIPISADSVLNNKNLSHENVVFIFLNKECPYTQIYIARIKTLIDFYKNVLFINLGNNRLESSKNLVQYHDKRKFLQYSLKVKKNPSVYFYHKSKGKFQLNYWGAIDDNPQLAEDVRHDYLKEAIKNTLSGQSYNFKESRPMGCNY